MGKSGILAHTKHKVAEIQPQINLQFHFTVKLSKLGEIVKPIWLTGNTICKQTWLTGRKNLIWLTSCNPNVKTRLLLLNVQKRNKMFNLEFFQVFSDTVNMQFFSLGIVPMGWRWIWPCAPPGHIPGYCQGAWAL